MTMILIIIIIQFIFPPVAYLICILFMVHTCVFQTQMTLLFLNVSYGLIQIFNLIILQYFDNKKIRS